MRLRGSIPSLVRTQSPIITTITSRTERLVDFVGGSRLCGAGGFVSKNSFSHKKKAKVTSNYKMKPFHTSIFEQAIIVIGINTDHIPPTHPLPFPFLSFPFLSYASYPKSEFTQDKSLGLRAKSSGFRSSLKPGARGGGPREKRKGLRGKEWRR